MPDEGTPRTIVGVMPPEISHVGLRNVLRGWLWIPVGPEEHDSRRDQRHLIVYGRLAEGVTGDLARARLGALARSLEISHPLENDGWGIAIEPLRFGFSPRTRAMMLMTMGAVSFVLLIACANVANLTLARANGRRREIATRLALGAPRTRIVRQLLTESLLVALASIPFGILLANWGRNLLLARAGSPELAAEVSIDSQVLLFSIAVAALATILSGHLPALHAIRRDPYNVLNSSGHHGSTSGPPHAGLSHALVIGEVALSLILLVGASLFVQSFRNALRAEGGFDTSQILALDVDMTAEKTVPPESASLRLSETVDRLRTLRGVTRAAAANLMPLRDGGERAAIIPDGLQVPPDRPPTVLLGGVTSQFFDVLNVPIVQGRAFAEDEDRSRSAVAVVNKTMARRLWPDGNAVGRRFRRAAGTGKDGGWFTIIGVSEDILTWNLSNRPLPTAYLPYAHVPVRQPALFIRASGDPLLLAQPARTAIHSADPSAIVLAVRTMTDVHQLVLSRNGTLAWLFAALGGVALLLGATGVYGVLSYFVSERTHEIGIRAALGADRRTLVRMFVRQGMTLALIGITSGLAGAWALARVLRGSLHDVSPTDPVSFAGVALLLIAVGLLATYLPARRAAAVDPLIAIRD